MIFTVIIFGFLFGSILQYAGLNRYNVISGMATLENYTVAKAIAVAIGAGAMLISLETGTGLASFHLKPVLVGGIAIGGLLFGTGMAILGYCPGTLAVSLGEGSLDALTGITGGLAGGLVYTVFLPLIKGILGPDLGSFSVYTLTEGHRFLFYMATFVAGGGFIALAFYINMKEKATDIRWFLSGLGLAVLNSVILLSSVSNRPIGASTSYPYVAGKLAGLTGNSYIKSIEGAGKWEVWLLAGAFLSGLVISVIRKRFRLTIVHSNWEKYFGKSPAKRLLWSFAGGFILIIGARMAGGCTSGHILSGGMQLSLSSLTFAIFVFSGLLLTGKYFYRKGA
jgi:uncharacterized membrane protein YedE/YeeE